MQPDSVDKSTDLFIKERFMANAKTKKTVKSTGSSPEKKSSKQKRIGQEKKLSVKNPTSRKKQQKVKTASKKTTSKKATTKVAVQRKSSKAYSNNGVYKAKDTLKVRRTNVNELKKVENVIERLSQGPEPIVQKVQEITPTVRRTVPGVLRIVHDVQDTVPSTPKAIPIVEAGNFLKKCVKQYWASA
jgi:hypothetical protein